MKHISDGWRESRVPAGEISAQAVEPIGILDQKVAAGELGRKSGRGFFSYA
jgi:3-hydroxyacyl-CoA dehydrogenase